MEKDGKVSLRLLKKSVSAEPEVLKHENSLIFSNFVIVAVWLTTNWNTFSHIYMSCKWEAVGLNLIQSTVFEILVSAKTRTYQNWLLIISSIRYFHNSSHDSSYLLLIKYLDKRWRLRDDVMTTRHYYV